MKYALDTEFIDTPTCSALISLAVVDAYGYARYFEFDYPRLEVTPWLAENVVPHLLGRKDTFEVARASLHEFFQGYRTSEVWAYYGAYDWYWLCRIFGGMMNLPPAIGHRHHEFARIAVPTDTNGPKHHALNDARSLMAAINSYGV